MVLTEDWLWTYAIAGCIPYWFYTVWVLIKVAQIYSHLIVKLPELLPEMIQYDYDEMKLVTDGMQVISPGKNNKNFMNWFLSCPSVYLRGFSFAGICHCVVGRMAAGNKGTMFLLEVGNRSPYNKLHPKRQENPLAYLKS